MTAAAPDHDAGRDLRARLPKVRGALEADAPLAPLTYFRVGGPADMLFTPEDEADLADMLHGLPDDIKVTVVGLGSNILVRDGGVRGLVIRLAKGLARVVVEPGNKIRAGAGAPDVKVARAARDASLEGFSFLRGIPGAIGGALRMNGGAYGREVADILVEARALDRKGGLHVLDLDAMQLSYRRCGAPGDLIFTEALFAGTPGERAVIDAEMKKISTERDSAQPVRSRTGGSTFKNPEGMRAWELIDQAGCRGMRLGDAQVSEHHCNFLINLGDAHAQDLEGLGEQVRAQVSARTGVELEWEIRRIGVPAGAGEQVS